MSDQSDARDLASLAHSYLQLRRCPGGRYVVKGFCCAHCGFDTSYGGCMEPAKENRQHMTKDKDGVWR
jgi:hypothetical protein